MYGKIFKQIYASSIAEDYLTRLVFMDFIVLAEADGVVDMTREAIARTTNVPPKIVNAAISRLEQPDPSSRSPEHQGIRLRRLDDHRDWGWQIVNYESYREMRDDKQRKEYMRSYMEQYRAQKAEQQELLTPVNTCKPQLANGSPSPSSYSCTSVQEGGTGGRVKIPPLIEVVKAIGLEIGLPPSECEKFWHHFESNGWRVGGKAPMKSVRSALFGWKSRMHEREGKGTGRPPSPPPPGIQLRAVEEELGRHPGNPDSVYCDRSHITDLMRKEFRSLQSKASELRRQIALSPQP